MLRSRGVREPSSGSDGTRKKRKVKSRKSSTKSGKGGGGGPSSVAATFLSLLFVGLVVAFVKGPSSLLFSAVVRTDDAEKSSETTARAVRSSLEQKRKRTTTKPSIYDLTFPDIHGTPVPLDQYDGFVTLVVNVASAWGKTNVSYRQLSTLQHRYGDRRFVVLAFPSNDFRQETGTNEEIDAFVRLHYPDCGFQMFQKSSLANNVVYETLHGHVEGRVKGNFYKYLVNRRGEAVALYGKKDEPFSFEDEIVKLLDEK